MTDTAGIHAVVWKDTFDNYLKKRTASKKLFIPFDITTDYEKYVDGMPRYDGVKNFLESREIEIPYGTPDDPPDMETICGIGNKKNQVFQSFLKKENIIVYDSTIKLIKSLRENSIKTAIVSSSKNCSKILEMTHISHLFDVKIDGVDSARLNLKGKPAPDIFITAAQKIGVETGRAVVVEDAISEVMAGRNGKFGLVIGVDRNNKAAELKNNGADVVVSDLSEIVISPL